MVRNDEREDTLSPRTPIMNNTTLFLLKKKKTLRIFVLLSQWQNTSCADLPLRLNKDNGIACMVLKSMSGASPIAFATFVLYFKKMEVHSIQSIFS